MDLLVSAGAGGCSSLLALAVGILNSFSKRTKALFTSFDTITEGALASSNSSWINFWFQVVQTHTKVVCI